MPDFRIQSLALGPYGTVAMNTNPTASFTKALLLPQQDTTPDITRGSYWLTENTSAVAITYFDGTLAGGQDGVEEGKIIFILFRDSMSTLVDGNRMFLAKSGGAFLRNEAIALIHSNSAWYEIMRSENSQSDVSVSNWGGTIAPNVDGVRMLVMRATAAATLAAISGGRIGQVVYAFSDSAGSAITVNQAGNIRISGTASFVMENSSCYIFVCRSANSWSVNRPSLTTVA